MHQVELISVNKDNYYKSKKVENFKYLEIKQKAKIFFKLISCLDIEKLSYKIFGENIKTSDFRLKSNFFIKLNNLLEWFVHVNVKLKHFIYILPKIFRALRIPITSRMLSEILSRLIETVAEQGEDMQVSFQIC